MGGFERNLTLAAGGFVGAGEVLFDAFVKAPVLGLGTVFGSALDQTYGRLTGSDYFSMHTENLGNFIGGTAGFLGQDHPLDSVFASVENRLSRGQALSDSDPFAAGRIFGGLGGEAALLGTGVGGLARSTYSAGQAGVGIARDIRALNGPISFAEPLAPLGFETAAEFGAFGRTLSRGLEGAGYRGTTSLLQGSAVTGQSFRTGQIFDDFGRVSDYDVALANPNLLAAAQDLGISTRSQGLRTGPLTAYDLGRLGLQPLARQLSGQAGRPVNFMIYRTPEAAVSRSQSLLIPNGQ